MRVPGLTGTKEGRRGGIALVGGAPLIGVAAAYAISNSKLRIMRIVHMMLMLPLVVPIIITAVGIFFGVAPARRAGPVRRLRAGGAQLTIVAGHLELHEAPVRAAILLEVAVMDDLTLLQDHRLVAHLLDVAQQVRLERLQPAFGAAGLGVAPGGGQRRPGAVCDVRHDGCPWWGAPRGRGVRWGPSSPPLVAAGVGDTPPVV